MKKLFCLLISISILLSTVCVKAESTNGYDESKYKLLAAIDAVDNVELADIAEETIARGEYIIYLMRLFGWGGQVYNGDALFDDVNSSDECYNAASIAKQRGFYPELSFYPEADITYGDAAEMLLRGMGYAVTLKSSTLITVMNDVDLPSFALDKALTMSDMTELFYSAVHAPLLSQDITSGTSAIYKADEEKTILTEYHNIEMLEGVLTHNGTTSIYSSERLSYPGFEIDEVAYGDQNRLAKPYLGHRVRAYVDYTENEDDGFLVYISDYRTELTTIDASDIETVNDRVTQITFADGDSGRRKNEKISENAKIIYNGKFLGNYTKNDIMPVNGAVELVDNDSDGTADVVCVWSYETMIIDYVSQTNFTIYNAYDAQTALQSLCLNEDEIDCEYEILWEDEELSFSDLRKDYVLSVARSKDADGYIKIMVSKMQFGGKVSGVNYNETEITIDGVAYPMLEEFMQEYSSISLSESYMFYIDSFGNIAAMTENDQEVSYIYAYLFKAYDNDETAMIRVFTQEADWMKYEIKDKIKYNGRRVEPYELLYGVNGDTQRSGIMPGGITERQVVKLVLDGGELLSLETAVAGDENEEFNKYSESIKYRDQNSSFDSKYFINDDTVIFGIPTDEPENMNAYMLNPSLTWDQEYNITAYCVDEFGDAEVFTIGVTSLRKVTKTCLVIDVVKELNSDDEAVTMLKCSFLNYGGFKIELDSSVNYSSIDRGDIITITTNELGKIIDFTTNFDYATQAGGTFYPDNFHSSTYLYGRILKVDPENERMLVNLGRERTKQGLRLSYSDLIIKIYDAEEKRVDIVSSYSLEPGDFIVVDNRASTTREIIVYKNL